MTLSQDDIELNDLMCSPTENNMETLYIVNNTKISILINLTENEIQITQTKLNTILSNMEQQGDSKNIIADKLEIIRKTN